MKSIYLEREWLNLQSVKENGEPIYYEYKDADGVITYPFIKRFAGCLNGVNYYDLASARGLSGPYVSDLKGNQNRLIEGFKKEFINFCEQEKIVAEFVKFCPWLKQWDLFKGMYEIEAYGNEFSNNLMRDFYHDEYSGKKRAHIRKAIRNGVSTRFVAGKNKEAVERFIGLYTYTEDKYDVSDYYRIDQAFLSQYQEQLSDRIFFAEALYEGRVISSALCLYGKDICHYHFIGTHPDYMNLQGNSLLAYEIALRAQRDGKKVFDLGGAGINSPLERFKKEFVKKVGPMKYYSGKAIRDKDTYIRLIEESGVNRDNYFPAYRQ